MDHFCNWIWLFLHLLHFFYIERLYNAQKEWRLASHKQTVIRLLAFLVDCDIAYNFVIKKKRIQHVKMRIPICEFLLREC